MVAGRLEKVLRYLRRARGPTAGDSDRSLLERFAVAHDEDAFAILVERHAPMVMAVCRRLLGDAHTAEDAFQAVFLVLARKAGRTRWQESVAGWLHEVAYRAALRARTTLARRRERTGEVPDMADASPPSDPTIRELRQVLDDELSRMPEKYRSPLVLCYLEGKTNEEAAALLGWTKGTVSGQLARARELLRARLSRRGLTMASSGIAAALTEAATQAAVSPATLRAAVQAGLAGAEAVSAAASTLAEGVLHAMFMTKLKMVAVAVLAISVIGAGMGFVAHRSLASASGAVAADPPAPPGQADPKAEAPRIVVGFPGRRQPLKDELLRKGSAVFKGGIERSARVEACVTGGVKWLVRHQAVDGHWSLDEFSDHGKCNCGHLAKHKDDVAATSLALLALLGHGQTHKGGPKESPFANAIEKGLAWLLTQQAADGQIGDNIHSHALAATALAEAYGMTLDLFLKVPALRAIDFLIKAQNDPANWKRIPAEAGPVGHSGAWQGMALVTGHMAGFNVPRPFPQAAPRPQVPGDREELAPAPLAARLLTLQYTAGWHPRHAALLKHLDTLPKPDEKSWDIEYFTFGSPLLYNVGGKRWDDWNLVVRDILINRQDQGLDGDHRDQKGSWSPKDDPAEPRGRLYMTALSVLTLETYYRHPPLYRE